MRPESRLEWIVLAGILLLAAALRMGAPGIIEFKRDEAALSQLALDMARGETFPLLGISSSVGIPNAPFNVYIMALPYLFSSDPTIATQFIGLLNVVAVGLTYALARRYYGVTAAIVVALVFAVSPWSVIYSRKIWAQDLLPFFILLTLGTGLIGFIEGKRWAQWLHLPLLVIIGQIHYGAFVIIPLSLYLILAGRKRWTRAFFFSVIPAFLLTLPYLIGLTQFLSQRSEAVIHAAEINTEAASAVRFTVEGIQYAVLNIAGTDLHSLAGPQQFERYLALVPPVYPLFYLLALAVLASALWLLIRLSRKRDQRSIVDGLLLLWLIVPILAFSFNWTTIYPHYLIPMMPAAFLILGVGAQHLWDSRKRLWRGVLAVCAILLGAILVLQVYLFIVLLGFLYSNNTPDGFGTPLAYLLPVRAVVLAQNPSQIIVNLDGQAVGFDGEATVWNFLLNDTADVRFIDAQTDLYPAADALFLTNCDRFGVRAVGVEVRSFNLRPSSESTTEDCYYLFTRLPEHFPTDYTTINDEGLTFDNGARIFGYRWDADCLSIFWEITRLADQNYTFSVHFTDAEDITVANADGLSWQGHYWRPGDRVIRTFCLTETNSEITGVNIGIYTYDGVNFDNSDLLAANGTPTGQTLSISFESAP